MARTKLLPWLVVALISMLPIYAISPIKAVGSKFFHSDGTQFFIKGIAYQLTNNDPLVDAGQCQRDAALMKEVGANAIRVYHVDATADHTECMAAFADANIYLFVDLDSFQTYISYDHVPAWTQAKSDSYRAVMDEFSKYDNTAGFFVGNENLNGLIDSGTAPFLLAAAVDLKGYRKARNYRQIPIGYSATDTGALPMLQDYFVCRPNETERLEFYSLNSYRWCGDSNYQAAYSSLQEAAAGYPIPIWFSEVGCNTVKPRLFNDQAAVFSSPMVNTWSGSMVYEWIQEINDYGLISYGPALAPDVQIGSSVIQGFTRQGTPTPIQPDFNNLKTQWATLNPTGVASQDYVKSMSSVSRSCPAFTADGWTVDPSAALPTLGQAYLANITPMSSVSLRPTSSRPSTVQSGSSPPQGDTKPTSSNAHAGTSPSAAASSTSAGAASVMSQPFSSVNHGLGGLTIGAALGIIAAVAMVVL